MRFPVRRLWLLPLAAAAACGSTTGVGGDKSNVVSALAIVSTGAETCKVSLNVGGTLYEPVGLPDSLAIVGLKLQVTGTIGNTPSTCMIGPKFVLTSVARARN